MVKIAVFDSGLGSLSIIKEIQKIVKSEIIYFGDQKNYPYGQKSKKELKKIIINSIELIKNNFNPDLIVVGSNTPTIILDIGDKKTIGVKPPLKEAEKISKTKNVGILGTKATIQSKELAEFIKNSHLHYGTKVHKINASSLVDLVESGKFLKDKNHCKKEIIKILKNKIIKRKIDVITLSSTHLSFLKLILREIFPDIEFIDPGFLVAKTIQKKIKNNKTRQNKLRIFSSGDIKKFQKNLVSLGIKNKVNFLSI